MGDTINVLLPTHNRLIPVQFLRLKNVVVENRSGQTRITI